MDDLAADSGEHADLVGVEGVDEQAPHLADVGGGGQLDLRVAGVGQGGVGASSAAGDLAPGQVAGVFQPFGGVRETSQRRRR